MTIVTKPLTSEKKPMDLVQPLVTIGVKNTNKDAEKGIPNERYHYVLRHEKPPSSAATLCLLILALFVMSVGLFGGIYIYREMTRARFQKLWCKVPYARNEAFAVGQPGDEFSEQLFANKENGGLKKIDNDGLSYFFGDESMKSDADTDLQLAESFFRENFELDTQNEQMAKIEVPDFKNGRMGRFIHEFDSNKTAIVDSSSGRCFIMPLDRDKVLPPRTMFDMIQKMANGYYTVNTKKIRETMRVVQPPITDFSDVGEYIKQECMEKNTYRLERSTRRIVKRNAAGKKEKPYAETVGYYTIEYDILNLDELP